MTIWQKSFKTWFKITQQLDNETLTKIMEDNYQTSRTFINNIDAKTL